MISMENGLRTLNIARLNPDSMRESTTQKEIVKGQIKNRIHIAAIQETHITQDRRYIMEKYRIITAAADKRETTGIVRGGTSIMIHESNQRHIARITRQSSRVLRVTMDHAESKMPIRIISTFAPKMVTEEERDIGDGEM